jgi:hypothetical protein
MLTLEVEMLYCESVKFEMQADGHWTWQLRLRRTPNGAEVGTLSGYRPTWRFYSAHNQLLRAVRHVGAIAPESAIIRRRERADGKLVPDKAYYWEFGAPIREY